VVILVLLGAAASLFIVFLVLRSHGATRSALGAVPADSFLVVSVDLPSLAASPLAKALVGDDDARREQLFGLETIQETCGFDPLPHLRSIALAVPEGVERGDFGVAATGDLGRDQLASCARAVIAKEGGDSQTTTAGSFTVVTDGRRRTGEVAELAFRDGGPFLVGSATWLPKMMDAAEGRAPSLVTSKTGGHGALRVELATRDIDAEAIELTAILPRDLRERLLHEMELETPSTETAASNATMAGVLAVSSVGIALHAGRPHEDTRLTALLHCESEDACKAVSTAILHARLGWSGNLKYRLFGVGPLIDGLAVTQEGTTLVVTTHAPTDDLAKVVDRALGLAGSKKGPRAPPSPATSAPESPLQTNDAGPARTGR
jgi:hypothetical protein